MVALDRFRVKVRLETKKPGPREGSNVWLQFGPRQRESPVVIGGMVWGVDSDGLITVLLSLTTPEFHSLKNLVNTLLSGETMPVPPRPMPSEPRPEAQVTFPVRPEPSNVNLAQQAEAPRPMPSEPRPEARVTPVPVRPEPSNVNLAQQAEALAARGDYEGAWRLYYQALQVASEDISLWYGLGMTLSHLNKRKETEEAFQYVVRHGRPDSEEVGLARRWLADARALAESAALTRVADPVGDVGRDKAAVKGKATRRASEPDRAPVQPPRSKPPEPSRAEQVEARVTPVPLRPESSNVNLARQAEALAARGDYEGAWKLYYQALQATPEDVSLWYALGVTASHLNQRKETEEPVQHMARHGRLDSKEVRQTDRALISAGALAELAALARVAEPIRDVREDKAAVKGNAARRVSEPGRAPVQPPRSKPSEPSRDRQAEARVTQRDYERASVRSAPRHRIDGESMTKDERERALLALIDEGHKMPPSRAELIAKIMEMRNKGDKERSKAPKKTRGRTRF